MQGAKLVNMAMRGLQLLWTVLVLALIGNMINEWNRGNNGVINYDIFAAIFSILSLFYLVPASFNESWAFHPIIPVVLDALNALFWFCGGVATAAELHVHSCSNQDYLNNNYITQGSSKRCREAQASTAFLWFGFVAFVVSAVLSGLGSRGSSSPRSTGRRGPAMSQV